MFLRKNQYNVANTRMEISRENFAIRLKVAGTLFTLSVVLGCVALWSTLVSATAQHWLLGNLGFRVVIAVLAFGALLVYEQGWLSQYSENSILGRFDRTNYSGRSPSLTTLLFKSILWPVLTLVGLLLWAAMTFLSFGLPLAAFAVYKFIRACIIRRREHTEYVNIQL